MKEYFSIIHTKYMACEGSMSRSVFWRFMLYQTLAFILTIIIDLLVVILTGSGQWAFTSLAFLLATFLPTICVLICRLHDTGRSMWHLLAAIVPVLGPAYLILILSQRAKAD